MYNKRSTKIIVIGGNDAGMAAAGRAKRRLPDADVVVLEKSANAAYASCSLPDFISGRLSLGDVRGPDPATIEEKRRFKVLLNHKAVDIDTRRRTVLVRDTAAHTEIDFKYDKLILSIGASPVMPAFAQINVDNLFSLRSVADAVRLKDFIDASQPRRAVVVGGGYIGLEIAEALTRQNMNVAIVEKEERLYPAFESEISGILTETLAGAGVAVIVGTEVKALRTQGGRATHVELSDGRTLSCDLVFVAAGIRPNVELAQKAGIPIGETGAILVNGRQQTRRMDIYAAGDCCQTIHAVTQRPIWSPLAGAASRQGRVAGDHAAGGRASFPGVLETSFVRVFAMEFGRTGLLPHQAREARIDAAVTIVTQDAMPEHAPGHSKITVALTWDRISKRVLGAQMIGGDGVGLRLNIVAAAIAAKMRVQELAWLDLGYTPTVNSMWDPVQVAAQIALKK